ncbi:AAA-like domain-containing protein [Nostocaceae cyanobacterium CENA369]|uniref:AAA-like domain-containing protein n=1 Tax=Dendronalium phyllosphericum CENA369 TaxID=1725256 RepID=A0A8J7HZ77_9NOST|nr:AAA-like domain-containing protein [Dendronalium phyllosphericum]MBH8573029.1 AAA-like domain-containing protein [Dendronalium phyllosphericum CENA369]
MVDQYIFSGSLPENASTYVTREADAQLYEGLKAGKFCYVLNSRQSGKSSLRVRTMQRLREDGVQCAAVDLSAGGIQNVPPEQWYADLIDTLIDTFGLDVDFGDWWSENQSNTLVTRFRKFLEEILLVEVKENIVIFIDEIDSVLSLNFPTDDFFALIRACYNKRVDNPDYNRLTFCLLGVASPSNLISDKQRTPFNIGQAISLKGFQPHEVEPLEKGLHGKFSNPQAIMQSILQWTGGQPFLTQKLCQFMVEESEQEHPRSVEQVVRSRIIENWESQDEPEHLRTIQARILRDEQRAGYLLELYQQVRLAQEQSQVIADETLEQSELQLSGLIVRQEGKLRIYNLIYREIFNSNWIETQLNNLRPYSENFRFWVASGYTDKSRLLQGNALQEAEEWARDKNLSYQDKQYLAASKEKEIQEKITTQEQKAALERARKDTEAAEARNYLLVEANKKAKQSIRNGTIVLFFTSLISLSLGLLAVDFKNKIDKNQELLQTAGEVANFLKKNQLNQNNNNNEDSLKKNSIKLSDLNLKIALMNLAASIYKIREKDLKKADIYLQKVNQYINQSELKYDSIERIQIYVFYLTAKGRLSHENKDKNSQIKFYEQAYDVIQLQKGRIFSKEVNILFKESVESLYQQLISLAKEIGNTTLKNKVEISLKEYYYLELENNLKINNWAKSDDITTDIARLEGLDKNNVDEVPIDKLQFYCSEFRKIDNLWHNYTQGEFSFTSQKNYFRMFQLGKYSSNEIITVINIRRQTKAKTLQKRNIFSVFVPPAIAGGPPEYPSLSLRIRNIFKPNNILSACPFKTDSAINVLVFSPPTNIHIKPRKVENGKVSEKEKCKINYQERILVYRDFNPDWYYTDACNGGWIHKSQVR